MITRLLLSLRKASASQEHEWSFGESTAHTALRFVECRGGAATIDAIYLDTFSSTREETQSRERLDGIKDVIGDLTSSPRRAPEDPAT